MTARKESATLAEDTFLIANWSSHTIRDLARMLGWREKSVRERARKLGLPGRREIALALTRKSDADRVARRKAVMALPEPPARPTAEGWSDGWSIKPPTLDQLRARR
jgi:hypothetical protein